MWDPHEYVAHPVVPAPGYQDHSLLAASGRGGGTRERVVAHRGLARPGP